jgi:hypothetical protein
VTPGAWGGLCSGRWQQRRGPGTGSVTISTAQRPRLTSATAIPSKSQPRRPLGGKDGGAPVCRDRWPKTMNAPLSFGVLRVLGVRAQSSSVRVSPGLDAQRVAIGCLRGSGRGPGLGGSCWARSPARAGMVRRDESPGSSRSSKAGRRAGFPGGRKPGLLVAVWCRSARRGGWPRAAVPTSRPHRTLIDGRCPRVRPRPCETHRCSADGNTQGVRCSGDDHPRGPRSAAGL